MLIPLDILVEKYNIQFKGILHVGAHECEEFIYYDKYLPRNKVLWVEAIPEKVEYCKQIHKDLVIEQAVVSDKVEMLNFNISNNGQSSSILDLDMHKIYHPHIHYVASFQSQTKLLKDIICSYDIEYNFLNFDIQGAELKALKGMEEYLPKVEYLYTEVNSDYVYKGCAIVEELDEYLKQFGLERVETCWTDFKWGDALYIRKYRTYKMYFDIGANIGRWSLENIKNSDKIIAVEAVTETYDKLKSNCVNYNNIECLNYAVCDNNGNDIIFYNCESDTLSTLNKEWLTHPDSRFCNIPYKEIICKTITIDMLIKKYGIPELIKIDVEGGEYMCILSLTQKVNNLCFEWASETSEITFKCIDYLYKLGFHKFFIQKEDEYKFRPDESLYISINEIKDILSKMISKVDWGMIWCK